MPNHQNVDGATGLGLPPARFGAAKPAKNVEMGEDAGRKSKLDSGGYEKIHVHGGRRLLPLEDLGLVRQDELDDAVNRIRFANRRVAKN